MNNIFCDLILTSHKFCGYFAHNYCKWIDPKMQLNKATWAKKIGINHEKPKFKTRLA